MPTITKPWKAPTVYDREKSIARIQDPWPECPVCGTMPDRAEGLVFRCINRSCLLNQRPIRGGFWRSGIFYRAIKLIGCPVCDAPFVVDGNVNKDMNYDFQLRCTQCGFSSRKTVRVGAELRNDLSRLNDLIVKTAQYGILDDMRANEDRWISRCSEERQNAGKTVRSFNDILNGNIVITTDRQITGSIQAMLTEQANMLQNKQKATAPDTGVAERARALMFLDDEE